MWPLGSIQRGSNLVQPWFDCKLDPVLMLHDTLTPLGVAAATSRPLWGLANSGYGCYITSEKSFWGSKVAIRLLDLFLRVVKMTVVRILILNTFKRKETSKLPSEEAVQIREVEKLARLGLNRQSGRRVCLCS